MKAFILDNIRSLQNIGAVFRTADCLGFEKIFLTGISETPPNLTINKTALSADQTIAWEYYPDKATLFQALKKQKITIIAAEKAPRSVKITDLARKLLPNVDLAVVLGAETTGVNDFWLKNSDYLCWIPMLGQKASLNVANAAGIIAYELNRSQFN